MAIVFLAAWTSFFYLCCNLGWKLTVKAALHWQEVLLSLGAIIVAIVIGSILSWVYDLFIKRRLYCPTVKLEDK